MDETTVFLLHGYCHLVNQTIQCVEKYFEGIVPAGRPDRQIYWKTKEIYDTVSELLEKGEKEQAKRTVMEYMAYCETYLKEGEPWKTWKEDRSLCRNTVLNCVQMVANLSVLMTPFVKYPALKVESWLDIKGDWQVQSVHSGYELPQTERIFLINPTADSGREKEESLIPMKQALKKAL